jgi:6-phosphofructokinase 2
MNPAIDTSTHVKNVIPDRKLRCEKPRHDAGGGGINVSRALKNLGGVSLAIYLSGGPTGRLLHDLLTSAGIKQLQVPTEEWTREDLSVMDDSTSQQYRFIMPGAEVKPAEWQACLDKIKGLPEAPEYLVASGSLPPGVPDDFFARMARLAKQSGSKFVLDTTGKPMKLALEEGVYLAKQNLNELCALTGRDLNEEPEQSNAAQEMVRRGQCKVMVLSLGAGGAIYANEEGSELLRAPATRVQSRVGAGDSMLAGIVLGLSRGNALRAAVRYGIAAGVAALINPGTQLCNKEDVERIYQRSA